MGQIKQVLIGFLVVLAAGCQASEAGISSGPTSTTQAVATATDTPKPTATFAPTATQSEVVQELPLSPFEANGLLDAARAAQPDVTWTTGSCVSYSEDICVKTLELCPEGNECTAVLAFIPRDKLVWVPAEQELFGDDYVVVILTKIDTSPFRRNLIFTEDDWKVFDCMYGPMGSDRGPYLTVQPVTDAVALALTHPDFGLNSIQFAQHKSAPQCDAN